MLEIILSTIILISPEDSTYVPFDITIIFDPPESPKSITIYLDEVEIEGKKERDYFYRMIENLTPGLHSIKVNINEKAKEWNFIVTREKDRFPIEILGNLSLGMQNYYHRDTLYSEEGGPIYGLDMTILKGTHSLSISLSHDPDYPSEWYPFLSYYRNKLLIEGGYIYPFWDEITIFSTGGFGITGEIDIGPLTLTPIFLYSKNYDSLFFEYPRLFYGGKIDFFKNNLHLGFTLFNAKDDTSNITGFPLSSPKKSLVVSPEIKWKVKDGIWLKLKGGYSNGNEDMYADISVNGNVFEGNIIYEGDFNNITIGLRRTSEKYLTLGNPYIHTGRTETFLTGAYELQFFYIDFDHLIYKKNEEFGLFLTTF